MGSRPDVVAELYRHSLPRLCAYAYLLTGSQPEAEDLVEAAIVTVCGRTRRLPDVARAEADVLAAIRSRHLAVPPRTSRWVRRRARPAMPDAAAGPGGNLAEADGVGLALATLSRQARTVIAMYYGEDLSVAEVAAALSLTDDVVKGCLQDGRNALVKLLGADTEPERFETMDIRP